MYWVGEPLIYIVLGVIIMTLAKLVNDWTTPYCVDTQLAKEDNPALAVSFVGYMLSVVAIFIGALSGPSLGLVYDLGLTTLYSVFGIILLNLSRIINDKLILSQFSNVKEIIEDRNIGTGAVQFGSYLAAGLIIAGSIQGNLDPVGDVTSSWLNTWYGGLVTASVFFALGQIVLIFFSKIYDWITPFSVHDEIEKDNVAAGIAFGGALLANGIVLMQASSGTFIDWSTNLGKFAAEAAALLVLLPFVRFVYDKCVYAKIDLNDEIVKDRNIGAGFLEAGGMIGFALIFIAALG
ncbi:MAG: DUF350 domain-containing protein [Opitutales bacterium]